MTPASLETTLSAYPHHQAESADFGDVRYTVHRMPDCPDAQVGMTVNVMWRMVVQDSGNQEFREWARRLVTGCGTELEKCEAIWRHVRRSIKFKQDEKVGGDTTIPVNPDDIVEVIVRPLDMMRYVREECAVGDCDDFSMYAAALLTVNWIECRFATVAADGRDPGQYTHVYCVAYPLTEDGFNPYKRERVPVDASHGEYCGWEVPNRYGKFREWGPNERGQTLATVIWVGLGVGLGWVLLKR
jgi:transglutaminase-like putative cysteine protease